MTKTGTKSTARLILNRILTPEMRKSLAAHLGHEPTEDDLDALADFYADKSEKEVGIKLPKLH